MNLWPLFPAILLIIGVFFAYKPGGPIDQFRDWRHGLAVDKTEVWRKFEDTFRDKT